jgi:ABC-type glycerol-3-phosphate transport system permease component
MSVVTAQPRPDARQARRLPRPLGRPPGAGPGRTPATLPYYIALVLLLVFALAPLLVFVGNAFKTQAEIGENPLGWPSNLRLDNFAEAWSTGGLGTGLRNSTIIVFATVLGVCVIAGCAAYALARLRLPGGNGVLLYLLVATALPFQAFLVPLFFLWSKLLLDDSLFGLVVIYWAIFSPFATLLLRSYLLTLPRELEDAARFDGAGELQVLRRVASARLAGLPHRRPGDRPRHLERVPVRHHLPAEPRLAPDRHRVPAVPAELHPELRPDQRRRRDHAAPHASAAPRPPAPLRRRPHRHRAQGLTHNSIKSSRRGWPTNSEARPSPPPVGTCRPPLTSSNGAGMSDRGRDPAI